MYEVTNLRFTFLVKADFKKTGISFRKWKTMEIEGKVKKYQSDSIEGIEQSLIEDGFTKVSVLDKSKSDIQKEKPQNITLSTGTCEICYQDFSADELKWDDNNKCTACPDCHTPSLDDYSG